MVSLFHFSRDDQAPRCGFAIGTGYRLIGALLLGIHLIGADFTGAGFGGIATHLLV
jgi:hypothetical protein